MPEPKPQCPIGTAGILVEAGGKAKRIGNVIPASVTGMSASCGAGPIRRASVATAARCAASGGSIRAMPEASRQIKKRPAAGQLASNALFISAIDCARP